MDESSESLFLENFNFEDTPVFFIYDRTAALEDGADPKVALLYPHLREEVTEADTVIVSEQIRVIVQVIGLTNKLEQELAKSLPVICRLAKVSFTFYNVGKYTLSLRRSSNYPEYVSKQELFMIYYLFNIFCGGFSTADVHTTNSREYNVDKEKASDIARLMEFFSKVNRPELASCVGSWSFKGMSSEYELGAAVTSRSEQKLASRISLVAESICMTEPVVGVLTMLNGKVLLAKNLSQTFLQALTLVLSNQVEEFGNCIDFGVNNVQVIMCYNLTADHIGSSMFNHEPNSFYALIHVKGDLSLTVLIKCHKNPAQDVEFESRWRRWCTNLKSQLLEIYHDLSLSSETASTPGREAVGSSVQRVKLHKQSNIVYASNGAVSPLNPNLLDNNWMDWYAKSVSIAQQAFSDMPSLSEIRLSSPSDYVLHATQGPVNNTFTGSTDIKNLPSKLGHQI